MSEKDEFLEVGNDEAGRKKREEFIAAVNASEAAMNAIEANVAGDEKLEKWKEIHQKLFHPHIYGLLTLIWRVVVTVFWFWLLGIAIPAVIGQGFAILIHVDPLPMPVQIAILIVFGTIFWLLPVYGLLIFFKIRKSQLSKEIAMLRQDPSLGWIPPDFRNVFCFRKLREYVQFNRAGSINEAIDKVSSEYYQAVAAANSGIHIHT